MPSPECPLILASASPRRRELLGGLGVPFEVIVPDVDERVGGAPDPAARTLILAERKARSAAAQVRRGLVIGADTLVAASDGEVIGKPAGREDARRILRKLSSARHRVITGVCVIDAATDRRVADAATTWVTMKPMTEAEIAAYVDSGEADDKAGAYAIQESGDRFVVNLEGEIDNVVGLPLAVVRRLLAEIGQE